MRKLCVSLRATTKMQPLPRASHIPSPILTRLPQTPYEGKHTAWLVPPVWEPPTTHFLACDREILSTRMWSKRHSEPTPRRTCNSTASEKGGWRAHRQRKSSGPLIMRTLHHRQHREENQRAVMVPLPRTMHPPHLRITRSRPTSATKPQSPTEQGVRQMVLL